MAINTTTFIKDAVLLVRDRLKDNLTDPISGGRPDESKFVVTSWPLKNVVYPVLVVQLTNMNTTPLGQASESVRLDGTIEVRVWARDVTERDGLAQEVIEYLRDNTLTVSTGFADQEMHDLTLDSAQTVDDPDPEGPRSKLLNFNFFTILGG